MTSLIKIMKLRNKSKYTITTMSFQIRVNKCINVQKLEEISFVFVCECLSLDKNKLKVRKIKQI